MSVSQQQPIFLSDDAFEMLVRRVPNEVIRGFDIANFEEAIGTSRERLDSIVQALSADGRTQAFIGPETTGYLRNALGVAILQMDPAEFQARTGYDREEGMELLRQLSRFRSDAPEAN